MTPFSIGDYSIPVGIRQTIELPISVLANHTPISLPVHVIHGAKPGPGMLLAFATLCGLAPARVAMVGDSRHDLMAGRAR